MSCVSGVFAGGEKLVVLAPHPDDESLGCGGLLARAFQGAGGHVICLTDGSASHPGSTAWSPQRLARQRRVELIEAIVRLGGSADDLTWLGMADGGLYRVDAESVADELEKIIADLDARHIFVPAAEDHHEDHKATAQFASALRARRPEWTFYSYPVWCRWDDPNFGQYIAGLSPVYLPLGDSRAKKRAAIDAHQSQLGKIVTDDPSGFTMASNFVATFLDEDEIFWRMP